MIKKLFCLSPAPGLAIGADPRANYSVQVVPAGSPPNNSPYVPAAIPGPLHERFNWTSPDTSNWRTVVAEGYNCQQQTNIQRKANNFSVSGGLLHQTYETQTDYIRTYHP